MEICIIEKAKKSIAKQTVSQFSLKPFKKGSRHNSTTEKCRALFKYEN